MSKGGHNKRKDSTNDYRSIDILLFQRKGQLTEKGAGYFQTYWTERRTGKQVGSMTTYTTPDYVRFIYATTHNWTGEKKDYDYYIEIDWTPCNYGGQRAWFICPECGDRAGKLYMKQGLFLCRHCQRLNYYSQQISKSDQTLEGIREKICTIQKKLKAKEIDHNCHWVPKPKGMHWDRYSRLLQKMRELQIKHDNMFAAICMSRFGCHF